MTDLMASPLDGCRVLLANGASRIAATIKRVEDLEMRLTMSTPPDRPATVHLKVELSGGGTALLEGVASYSVNFGDEYGLVVNLRALHGPNDEKALRTMASRLFAGRDFGADAFQGRAKRGRLKLLSASPKSFTVDQLDDGRGSAIAPPPTPAIAVGEPAPVTVPQGGSSPRKVLEGTASVRVTVTVSLESEMREAVVYRSSEDGQRLLVCVEGRSPLFGARADITCDGDAQGEPTLLYGAVTWVGRQLPTGCSCAIRISRRTCEDDQQRWAEVIGAALESDGGDDAADDASPPQDVWASLAKILRSRGPLS